MEITATFFIIFCPYYINSLFLGQFKYKAMPNIILIIVIIACLGFIYISIIPFFRKDEKGTNNTKCGKCNSTNLKLENCEPIGIPDNSSDYSEYICNDCGNKFTTIS